jgi:7,8-dihydropterin-6-yl-methyl-4-(beta-D-ribofuranosyl)aminobenzene 5'-phosphate synthase
VPTLAERTAGTVTPTSDARLTITIIYDNYSHDPRLTTAWGFATLVEYRDQTVLFDTGGDGQVLLDNMNVLGIDPASIEHVVLSHIHGDHVGGLGALLETGARSTVYLPPSFPADFKRQLDELVTVVEVTPGQRIARGLFTTGEMGAGIREQALVIETGQGSVVITGCAHPGIVEIVARARELSGKPIYLVLGGFHLGSKGDDQIETIITGFRRMGVEKVAPCHCTGDRAIAMFATEYGNDFIRVGAGKAVVIEG